MVFMFFCQRWAPFFQITQRWAPFFTVFSVCPDFQVFYKDFNGFSAHRPAPYTAEPERFTFLATLNHCVLLRRNICKLEPVINFCNWD